MNETMKFEIALEAPCSKQEARALGAVGALCLREAVDEKAEIYWPGEIVVNGGTAASVTCAVREGGALLRFSVSAPYARASLPDELEAALRVWTDGFPQNGAALIQAYCNHCKTLMKFVDTTYHGMPVYGFAFAIDKYGGLMVMTQPSRAVVTVYSGRAELAKDEPQQPDMPVMPRV